MKERGQESHRDRVGRYLAMKADYARILTRTHENALFTSDLRQAQASIERAACEGRYHTEIRLEGADLSNRANRLGDALTQDGFNVVYGYSPGDSRVVAYIHWAR